MADTRFEVRLNQRLADDFDRVARETGLTRAEVFRRAIALYKTLKQEEGDQGHVILRSKDGAERELVNIRWLYRSRLHHKLIWPKTGLSIRPKAMGSALSS